jgi:hypothetical protein
MGRDLQLFFRIFLGPRGPVCLTGRHTGTENQG